jgi:hypothetical protein
MTAVAMWMKEIVDATGLLLVEVKGRRRSGL